MKILFLHPNFPGQFKHIAKQLGRDHDVKFMCQTHFGRKLEGVNRICLKGKLGHEYLEQNNQSLVERSKLMSTQFREGFEQLSRQGWEPQIVISHSAWGCGLYVKELWPEAKLISYCEWWFDPQSEFFTYDQKNIELNLNPSKIRKYWDRNASISLELAVSNAIISPTQWQKNQLPESFKKHCYVIFDGVDNHVFKPDQNKKSTEPLITYGTRGMEPMRCFPQFIRELPTIVAKKPEVRIEIAGEDRCSYGGTKPKEGSWKIWAKRFLSENKISDNVKWLGYLGGEDYINWLQSSWAHVYLTHPFVTSWSFVEALHVGAPIVISDLDSTKEFLHKDENIILVDHRKPGEIAQAVLNILNRTPFQYNAKKDLCIDTAVKKWQYVLNKILKQENSAI